MAGGQFHRFRAIGILDDQLAAVVFLRAGEKERAGQVRAQAVIRARDDADRTVREAAKESTETTPLPPGLQ